MARRLTSTIWVGISVFVAFLVLAELRELALFLYSGEGRASSTGGGNAHNDGGGSRRGRTFDAIAAAGGPTREQVAVHVKQAYNVCAAGVLRPKWRQGGGAAASFLTPNKNCPQRLIDHREHQYSTTLQAGGAHGAVGGGRQPIFSVVMLYYRDTVLLSRHLLQWAAWSADVREKVSFVIIDDGSPAPDKARGVVHDHTEAASKLRLAVYEITEDLTWNIGGARNLGMTVAETSFVFLTDIDNELNEALLGDIAFRVPNMNPNAPVCFRQFRRMRWAPSPPGGNASAERVTLVPKKPSPATVLISKQNYWRVGGCDEDFVGHYGHTDPHFWWRVNRTPRFQEKQATDIGEPMVEIDENTPGLASVGGLQQNRTTTPAEAVSGRRKTGDGEGGGGGSRIAIRQDRDPLWNEALFRLKMSGDVPWSRYYLRFHWEKVY